MKVSELVKETSDVRYLFVRCPHCGKTYQTIDFRCAIHMATCSGDPSKVDIGSLEVIGG